MKFRCLPFAAALMLSSSPAMAQDLGDIFGPGPNPITMFKEIFKAEPLSPAEEARLPAAQQVAGSLLPPGAYGKLLEDSFSPMLERILGMVEQDRATRAARLTKLSKYDLEGLDQTKLDAIIAMLDPKADERNQQVVDFIFAELAAAMVKIEPYYRDGLARAYARHFDAAQLAEINAFFATPTGKLYASRSLAMNVDPQVMATIPDMIPVIVGHVAEAGTRFVLATDTIPQARKVDDLSPAERARLLGLLGLSEEEYSTLSAEGPEIDWDAESLDDGDFDSEDDGGLTESTVIGGLEPVN